MYDVPTVAEAEGDLQAAERSYRRAIGELVKLQGRSGQATVLASRLGDECRRNPEMFQHAIEALRSMASIVQSEEDLLFASKVEEMEEAS